MWAGSHHNVQCAENNLCGQVSCSAHQAFAPREVNNAVLTIIFCLMGGYELDFGASWYHFAFTLSFSSVTKLGFSFKGLLLPLTHSPLA